MWFPQQLSMCDSFTSHFWKGASSASFSDFFINRNLMKSQSVSPNYKHHGWSQALKVFESGTQNHVLSLLFKGLTNFNGEDLKKIPLTWIPSRKIYNFIGNLGKHLLFGTQKKFGSTSTKNLTKVFLLYGGFLKWSYPTTMGFPTKNDHFGVWNGDTTI